MFLTDTDDGFCPHCGEELNDESFCFNGCLDDDESIDFEEEEDDIFGPENNLFEDEDESLLSSYDVDSVDENVGRLPEW
jgi:hypothetical protein